MAGDRLTEQEYWNDYWGEFALPAEIKKSNNLYINEILNTFDRYLPKDNRLSILEIGGAPGQYLAYMHRQFGYHVNSLDYSETGCKITRENFKLLNIHGTIYEKDFFSEEPALPQFDIVYSLGLVEHFSDLDLIIGKHLDLLKPGGILLIGAPNYLGIYQFFLKRLAPGLLSLHNLRTMDVRTWRSFEDTFRLEPVFKGYVGGPEANLLNRCETKSLVNTLLRGSARGVGRLTQSHFKVLRKINSRNISGYVLGIYKKPLAGRDTA